MRIDSSRSETELRPIKARQGLLNRAHGSARFSFGDSSCLCAVFEDNSESITSTFHPLQKPLIDPLSQSMIKECVLHFCRSSFVHVITQVMHDNGSILSAAFNSAIFALIDAGLSLTSSQLSWLFAGIPLIDHGGSATCVVNTKGEFVLDPTLAEEKVLKYSF